MCVLNSVWILSFDDCVLNSVLVVVKICIFSSGWILSIDSIYSKITFCQACYLCRSFQIRFNLSRRKNALFFQWIWAGLYVFQPSLSIYCSQRNQQTIILQSFSILVSSLQCLAKNLCWNCHYWFYYLVALIIIVFISCIKIPQLYFATAFLDVLQFYFCMF
jgi:hypothetical protein